MCCPGDKFPIPLGMDDCRAGASHVRGMENRATPHLLIDGTMQTTGFEESDFIAAAGGIHCSADGMSSWMKMWLSGGKTEEGEILISPGQLKELWSPVTLMRTSGPLVEALAIDKLHSHATLSRLINQWLHPLVGSALQHHEDPDPSRG